MKTICYKCNAKIKKDISVRRKISTELWKEILRTKYLLWHKHNIYMTNDVEVSRFLAEQIAKNREEVEEGWQAVF